jgi:hypothetical protein
LLGRDPGRTARPGGVVRDTGKVPARADQREPDAGWTERARKKERVGILAVLAGAARIGRRHWWRILTVAVTVSAVTTLAELLVDELVGQDDLPWSLIGDLTASGLSLLGAVFISGFLTKLVGHSQESDKKHRPDHGVSIRRVLATMPWGALIGADLLVALIVVVGLLLLVVPGLIAFNLLALAGPVIEVENRKIISSLRRSARLVRGHFWTVALLATLPVAAASEIEALAPNPHGLAEFLKVLAIRGLAEGIAEAIIGLILVQLSHRLMALDQKENTVDL